ncbi:protein FRA10AC1 homolog [Caerostris extrusa]|uniref:Protein FRA10AC1 homolog n=1 Tax=Caerostris extrusa TaxID=172846 RepID=A0AAV4QDS3_CAEEX|nr:protein FRA10AC1 homolog [Caerostris extrusa]
MEENRNSFTIPINEDYDSEFEYDVGDKRKARQDLATKAPVSKVYKPNKQDYPEQCAYEQSKVQRQAYLSLDAYTRHKKLINDYVLCYEGATAKLKRNTSNYKTDQDIIRENHRFLWEEKDEAHTWGEQLAKKYYDRLFKEYCLCDLTRYKEKKVGMRWRNEKEVVVGKGQFFCGNVHCEKQDGLESWEVLFGYHEHGEKKNALVKLRLCDKCSYKLHYGYKGKAALKKKHKKGKRQEKEVDFNHMDNVTESDKDSNTESSENKTKLPDEGDIWKQPIKEDVEQSKEDAFEEFLEDLFL